MRILTTIAFAVLLASCSTAYKQGQTPDDVYYSPGKEKTLAKANNSQQDDRVARNNSDYQDYTTSSDDRYLRMKIQNRYRWDALDNTDYWSSPSYAYNNYYGNNSFNPLSFNSWGLSYYYSPFASIQPYGWFNNYYPTYGYYGNYGGNYVHGYGYGYSPVYVVNAATPRYNVHRPMLGGYVNNSANGYSNSNRNSSGSRYIPANNTTGRYYNNTNSSANTNRTNNDNSFNRTNTNSNTNTNTNSAPARSFTPASSGSSSGGGVTRQPR